MEDAHALAHAIVNTIHEPFIVLGADLRVVAASRSFYSAFKVEPVRTLGYLLYDLGDGQWNIPALRELLETIIPRQVAMDNFEVEHDFPGIGRRIMLLNARKVIYDTSSNTTILLAITDITVRRALEDDLRRRTADAEAATISKAEFLANMSHEIRTPLTGMLGFAGLLAAMNDLPETAQKYVSRIATSGEALLSVVNDVLDFSKLDANRIELDPHPFDPEALVVGALDLVVAAAERKGLYLNSVFNGALPAAVFADSARVRQVLLNLLTNAIKFTEAGGVTVTTGYLAEDDRLHIAVTDSGVGIPEDQHGRLFQRFSQMDGSNTRQNGGTGLGLAICKGFVEMMGGQIALESSEGVGSTVWFTIEAPITVMEPVMAAPAVYDFDLASLRILVVDDVAVNRELVQAMLAPFGIEIREAANGADAVAAALAEPFDMILMDLQMPSMDGIDATKAIRASSDFNRRTPIVALSANVMSVHLVQCQDAGMNDHIAKPIVPADLLTKVAYWASVQQEGPTP